MPPCLYHKSETSKELKIKIAKIDTTLLVRDHSKSSLFYGQLYYYRKKSFTYKRRRSKTDLFAFNSNKK